MSTVILQCTQCSKIDKWHTASLSKSTECPCCGGKIAVQLKSVGLRILDGPKHFMFFKDSRDVIERTQRGGCCG